MSTHPLKPLFDPQSIAIVGASNDVRKFGGRPIRFMKEAGFAGRIFPINPRESEIQDLPCFASAKEIGEPVDMAVISVPAKHAVNAIRDCGEAGVKSAVIFSSGFAEVDDAGAAAQAELRAISEETGIRLVGPNCMGMMNTTTHAIGTFSSAFEHGWPKAGHVSIISQSGAVGSHTLVLARERGLGVRGWMTTGNEVDVDVADCLDFVAEDEHTKVICAYMEGCRQPEKLIGALDKARRRGKPVIIMKVGASDVGAHAANTHTASLAGADAVFDAVFRSYGACRVESLEEMMDIAVACSAGVFPTRNRLGILTISGGVGVLSSDAASVHGLDVPALPDEAQRQLKELVPFAAVRNPVDTTAEVLNNMPLLEQNFEVLIEHGDIDAMLVFLSSSGLNQTLMGAYRDIFPRLRAKYPDALIALSLIAAPDDVRLLEGERFLCIEDPVRAIRALAALVGFGRAFAGADTSSAPPALPAAASALPAGGALSELDALALLRDAGVPTVDARLARDADEAARHAQEIGFPVVLKVVSAEIQHKSDIGGVRLGLADAEAVRAAYGEIATAVAAAAPQAAVDGILVAPQVAGGVETIMGVTMDPVFGPTVLFGLGGVFVEVLKDVTFRVAPFDQAEARRMIDEVKGRALLSGVRGAPPADIPALADALARLSVFAHENRERLEGIDVNPFLVLPEGQGAVAVDALILTREG